MNKYYNVLSSNELLITKVVTMPKHTTALFIVKTNDSKIKVSLKTVDAYDATSIKTSIRPEVYEFLTNKRLRVLFDTVTKLVVKDPTTSFTCEYSLSDLDAPGTTI